MIPPTLTGLIRARLAKLCQDLGHAREGEKCKRQEWEGYRDQVRTLEAERAELEQFLGEHGELTSAAAQAIKDAIGRVVVVQSPERPEGGAS